MSDNRPVGVYDSGIGGLTVFKKLSALLPEENFIYYGDTINIPYGTKTKEELLKITKKTMLFFKEKNVKAVVMACNTTSAAVYEDLKNEVDFILYPLVQNACFQIAAMNIKSIGVLSTEVTAKSHAYKINLQKYSPSLKVFEHGCPSDWVKMVENNSVENTENKKVIEENLKVLLDNKAEKIILGCTHYPYLRKILSSFAGKDIFIDPSEYFANFVVKDLQEKDMLSEKNIFAPQFFVTSNPEQFFNSSKLFYELESVPILV